MTIAYELYRGLKGGGIGTLCNDRSIVKHIIRHLELSDKFILPTVQAHPSDTSSSLFKEAVEKKSFNLSYPDPWLPPDALAEKKCLPYNSITVEYKFMRTQTLCDEYVILARNKGDDPRDGFEYFCLFRDNIDYTWYLQSFKGDYHDDLLGDQNGFDFHKIGEEYRKSDYKQLEMFVSTTVRALSTVASLRDGLELNTPYFHKAGIRSAMSKKRRMFAHRQLFFSPIPVQREKREPVGTHASPAMHKRRGHFRQLRSGKVVWVKSSIVGKPENGVVTKDYVMEGVNQ